MKKKALMGLALLAPLALAVGCGGTMTLGFSPNWYYDNTVENSTGKDETLEYEVTFAANATDGVSVRYEKGTYVTKLTAENVAQGDTTVPAYRFHTELQIAGRYERGSERGDVFEDVMTTDVWFARATAGLRPIRSQKAVRSTVPYSAQGSSDWYATYEFSYSLSYAADLSEADYTLSVTAPEAQKRDKQGKIDLGFDETFLDNEEIVIALRGLDLNSSSAAVPFVTIDPQTQDPVTVNLSTESVKSAVAFSIGDEAVSGTIDAVRVSCSYSADQPGPTRRFLYAARTDETSKKYRSVLLSFENPVMYNLGTMTYTLKKATFNDR